MTVGTTPYDYAFDPNGNLTTEAATRRFGWNHSDQLVTFATQTPGAEPSIHAQYLYDSDGQRVKKFVRRQGGAVEVTHYIGQIFEHHRWTGALGGENNHVHVMDDRQRVALVRAGPAHPDDRGPAVAVHLVDHLGSSMAVVDHAGVLTNREEYTPYAETSFGSFTRKRYRHTSKERDGESGLIYVGARHYAPAVGRWMSCDPKGGGSGAQLYQYCASDPVNKHDPNGAEWCWNPFASGCGIDWELVGQVASTAEVLLGCGAIPITDGLSAAVCLDGLDNWTASSTNQPTVKQVVISQGFRAAGMPDEHADQVAGMQAAIFSAWLGAAQAVRPTGSRPTSTPPPPAAPKAVRALVKTWRTMSREPIRGAKVMELDSSVLKGLRKAGDSQHGFATAFVAANKDATFVVGTPARIEMFGEKASFPSIKKELEPLGLHADVSLKLGDIEPLAGRYMRAFEGTGRKFHRPDALNLASAQLSKRTLVTADNGLFRRARDLGVTNIKFVGSPENTALANRYDPRPVAVK